MNNHRLHQRISRWAVSFLFYFFSQQPVRSSLYIFVHWPITEVRNNVVMYAIQYTKVRVPIHLWGKRNIEYWGMNNGILFYWRNDPPALGSETCHMVCLTGLVLQYHNLELLFLTHIFSIQRCLTYVLSISYLVRRFWFPYISFFLFWLLIGYKRRRVIQKYLHGHDDYDIFFGLACYC